MGFRSVGEADVMSLMTMVNHYLERTHQIQDGKQYFNANQGIRLAQSQ